MLFFWQLTSGGFMRGVASEIKDSTVQAFLSNMKMTKWLLIKLEKEGGRLVKCPDL